MDIISRPFVRLADGTTYPLERIRVTWMDQLRQRLVESGGQVERFGRVWEQFAAYTLEQHGWAVVGKSIKLKKPNKQVLTDIDVLAVRNGLVLAIQVKAFAQAADTVYSHWKARAGIEKGVDQARLAASFLRDNPDFLSQLLASKKCSETIATVQPFVLTNAVYFSGWKLGGIAIVGLSDLMSLLNGAKVRIQGHDNIVEEVRFCADPEPSSDDFLRILSSPISFDLAAETDSIDHFSAGIGPVDLQIPIHSRRDGRSWSRT
jgi:hypothetical protein